MKKTFITAAIMAIVLLASAQVVSSYQSIGEQYDIEVSEWEVKIGTADGDTFNKNRKCVIPITDIDTFVGQLKMVKAKYIEWERVAKENNITTDIAKFMPEGPQPIMAYLEWDFAHETHRTSTKVEMGALYINKERWYSAIAIMLVGEPAESASNQFIKYEGAAVLMFLGADEIQSLIDGLDKNRINKHITDKQQIDGLFK